MMKRTTTRTITFAHPFALNGIDELQPAGSYIVETDEELIQSLSFPAYRSTGTWIRLPSQSHHATATQAVKLTHAELEAALAKDALPIPADPRPAKSVFPLPVPHATPIKGFLSQRSRCLMASMTRMWHW